MAASNPRQASSLRRLIAVAALAALAGVLAVAPAQAAFTDFAIDSVGGELSSAQAGAHADVTTAIDMATDGEGQPHARTKDVAVHLPPGMMGNPNAVPQCSEAQFLTIFVGCPKETQVGVAYLKLYGFGDTVFSEPIFNVETPNRNMVARLGFHAVAYPTFINVGVRSESDYGITATVSSASAQANLISVRTVLWGVPADPSHDAERMTVEDALFCGAPCNGPSASEIEPAPFMTNPTSCGPIGVAFDAVSYAAPGSPASASAPFPDIAGCDKLAFQPGMSVKPTSRVAAAPTGLDVGLDFAQDEGIASLATSHLRDARVTLPEGMTVAAGSAHGLEACGAEQVGYRTRQPSGCPAAAKIGSVTFDVPALPEKLEGSVYLRKPEPGKLLRLWLVADDLGVHLKVPGEIQADPVTGRLTTVFTDNPQTPLASLRMSLKGGPFGVLTNPSACGQYETTGQMTPWSGEPPVDVVSSMAIDQGCDTGGFAPGFEAGATSPVAGAFSPFLVRVTRGDGDREIGRIDVTLPKGSLADLTDVEVCSAAQVAQAAGRAGIASQGTPACPAASQIGTTTAGAGAGPSPFFPRLPGSDVSGRVFLTDGYTNPETRPAASNPAPYGLAIEVPAVAGPFDLGTVLIRAGVYVNPVTAQLTVISDPLPRILEGIPLNLRDIRIAVDRERFTVNPTSCAATQVTGAIRSQDGAVVERAARYQAGECQRLGLAPKMAMRLTGAKHTREGGHPALRVSLRQPPGQTNISRVRVVLPKSLALDPENANDSGLLCSYESGLAGDCPASSVIGSATAVSPLLKRPLRGKVHFVQGVRFDKRTGSRIRTLPTLLVKLRGEITIDLRAKTAVSQGNLVSTFPVVPDAKISRFRLNLKGGAADGILTVSGRPNLCPRAQRAAVTYGGHNGRTYKQTVSVGTPCKKRPGSRRKR
jgi:hypothetical protein